MPFAVANYTDDVRVFAGCLTGRARLADRGLRGCAGAAAGRRARACRTRGRSHVSEDEQRPRFHCRVVHASRTRRSSGFNRAQAAVIEAAILVSRLHLLPRDKVEREMAYLEIAVSKTASTQPKKRLGLVAECRNCVLRKKKK